MVFHKYIKIKRIGDEENKDIFLDPNDLIVIEEKIDGANFRFMIKDNNIIFGSRTKELGEDDKQEKAWKRCIQFIKDKLKDKDLKLLEGRIYYGECCTKHTMSYDWEKIPPFLGFDVYCLKHEKFLYRKDLIFFGMALPIVPIIKTVKASEIKDITDNDVPESKYASQYSQDKKAEGIVFKNYSKQIFAKYVRDKFKEANAETFGGSPKYNKLENDNSDIIVYKYCTNARIDKIIFKLIDQGYKLEMKLMEHLPLTVYQDIWEEEWKTFRDSRWVINTKNLRKMITKRCVAVLKQVIVNNSLK